MWTPTLDARLEAVLGLIRAGAHADIGSDHAGLPIHLIRAGRAGRCVVVEVNPGPLRRARENVARAGLACQIEVRPGDGFAPLLPGELGSASLTGMGARTIAAILSRAGEGVPPALVLQPNDSAAALRIWARGAGYHLTAERLVSGHGLYPVLRLERRAGPDPAYMALPGAAALRYGPLLLREGPDVLRAQVAADLARLTPHARPGRPAAAQLAVARSAWDLLTAHHHAR